jgi:hypothetical protein
MGTKLQYRGEILDVVRGRDQYNRYVYFRLYDGDPTKVKTNLIANLGNLHDAAVAAEALRSAGHEGAKYVVSVSDKRPDLDDLSGGL